VILSLQKPFSFGYEILPNLNYASSPPFNPLKSEGGQVIFSIDKMAAFGMVALTIETRPSLSEGAVDGKRP